VVSHKNCITGIHDDDGSKSCQTAMLCLLASVPVSMLELGADGMVRLVEVMRFLASKLIQPDLPEGMYSSSATAPSLEPSSSDGSLGRDLFFDDAMAVEDGTTGAGV